MTSKGQGQEKTSDFIARSWGFERAPLLGDGIGDAHTSVLGVGYDNIANSAKALLAYRLEM